MKTTFITETYSMNEYLKDIPIENALASDAGLYARILFFYIGEDSQLYILLERRKAKGTAKRVQKQINLILPEFLLPFDKQISVEDTIAAMNLGVVPINAIPIGALMSDIYNSDRAEEMLIAEIMPPVFEDANRMVVAKTEKGDIGAIPFAAITEALQQNVIMDATTRTLLLEFYFMVVTHSQQNNRLIQQPQGTDNIPFVDTTNVSDETIQAMTQKDYGQLFK